MASILEVLRRIGGAKAPSHSGRAGQLSFWKSGRGPSDSIALFIHDGSGWLPVVDTSYRASVVDFGTVADLIGDSTLAPMSAGIGKFISAGGFRYRVAAPTAFDHHVTTAGGVKLYVMPDTVGINVMAFGAKADGLTDDTTALQKAIDAYKPTTVSAPTKSKLIYFPAGTYVLLRPLQLWSGTHVYGDGVGTIIRSGNPAPTNLFELAGNGATDSSNQYKNASIDGIHFSASSGGWAIKSLAGLTLNSVFTNLTFNCNFGIDVATDTYTQGCRFQNLYSIGPLDQIIKLRGNFNLIEDVDKESGSGVSVDPYIFLYGDPDGTLCNGNILRKILLEGSGSINKTPIKFQNAWGNYLHDTWLECNASNGYGVYLDNSRITMTGNTPFRSTTLFLTGVKNKSMLVVDRADTNSQDFPWTSFFDVDSTSTVDVNSVYDRRSSDMMQVDSPNVRARRFTNSTLLQTPQAGFSADTATLGYVGGQNMFVNGSFEAGVYGWVINASLTPTILASEVSFGNMIQLDTQTGGIMAQTFTVPESLIGRPLTISALVKVVGTGFAIPYVQDQNSLGTNRITAGLGWQRMKITYRPTAGGVGTFGIRLLGMTSATAVYIDEMTLSFGEEIVLNPAKFGSFELNQLTFAAADAIPETGTWKRGDRVFNSRPSLGQPKSWVCTVAGSPGTWVSEGNL